MRHGLVVLLLIGCQEDPPAEEVPDGELCPVDPGPPHGMRRLTTFQYDRVIADLLGEPDTWTAEFPPASGGWEGLWEAQPVPATLVEAWSSAAEAVADRILERGPRQWRVEAEAQAWPVGMETGLATDGGSSWWAIDLAADTQVFPLTVSVPMDGQYALTVRAVWSIGWTLTEDPPDLALVVRGSPLGAKALTGTFEAPQELTWSVSLPAGESVVELFVFGSTHALGQGIAVDHLTVDGPTDDPFATDGPVRRRLIRCDPEAIGELVCARQVLTGLGSAAWRRPIQPAEVDELLGLVELAIDEGDDFEVGMRLALRGVLLSPEFLFRADDVSALPAGGSRSATAWELASRLSFALWGSIPDPELTICAAAGQLGPGTDECSLKAQVDRLLADPRADAFAFDFGRQWLGLDALAAISRDPTRYPDFDGDLVASMAAETYALLGAVAVGPDLMELVDASQTTVDGRLAELYGMSVGASELPPDRRGLLGHASVLALTSHADRTSPVQRGKYVLDRLLCDPPDPPPDGIPQLPSDAADGDVASILAAHRADPACAGCHDVIDPLGLALEGYDAVGARRSAYPDGQPVQVDGALPDGTPVTDLAGLSAALAVHPQVQACLVRSITTWALERVTGPGDACLLQSAAGGDGSASDVLRAVVQSPAFTTVVAP